MQRFATPVSATVQRFAALQFALLMAGAGVFLWFSGGWPMWQSATWFAVLLAGLWALGAVLQNRITLTEALMIECAALSMATAASGLQAWHWAFKPLTLLLALAAVVAHWRSPSRTTRPSPWLFAALMGALAGDVFLMFEGFFIPGLIAFLLAHASYLLLFRQDAPMLASRPAWAACCATGMVFYAFLWSNGLPEALRLPVAVYVLAIVAMGSVALGRAVVLGDGPSRLVATGAVFFMVSDATLAINRFVVTVPHDPVWVLGSYYAAQCLIVIGLLRAMTATNHAADGAARPVQAQAALQPPSLNS